MDEEARSDVNQEMTISLTLPVPDDDLFNHIAANDILLFLANHRFDEITRKDLNDTLEYSNSAITRALEVLVENNLVDVELDKNQYLYTIDRDRLDVPDDPIMRIPQSEFHEPVRYAVDRFESEIDDLVAVVLYGSVARGEADRQSDIDLWLLVTSDRMSAQRAVNDLLNELEETRFNEAEERFDFHVDVESPRSIPRYTEDIKRIINSGIELKSTGEFDKAKTIINDMLEESEHE